MLRRRSPASLFVVLGIGLSGCGDDAARPPGASSSGVGGSGGDGGAGGGPPACVGAPGATPEDWCAHVPAGPAGSGEVALQISRAHAFARFFGAVPSYGAADLALAGALETPATIAAPDLAAYAASLAGAVCVPTSAGRTLEAARVELVGDVAWIEPGTGEVAYPTGAKAAVIDLRGLPFDAELAAVLTAALSPALATPVERPLARVRRHEGMIDEIFAPMNVYKSSTPTLDAEPLPATGAVELPIVLLTEAVMPAEAVELAATLRLAGRASLFGEDLAIGAAEAHWLAVGSSGVAVRWRDLEGPAGRWPDVVRADVREGEPSCLVGSAADVPGAPTPATTSGDTRPHVEVASPFGTEHPAAESAGIARAGLILAHGAASTFFGYPDDADDLDARLIETLAAVDAAPALDRVTIRDAFRRFGHVLNDGHCFVFDNSSGVVGYFAVVIEDIGGEAVVRRSATPGVAAGDAIVSIGGTPAADWYATELQRTSAATEGYRHDLATRFFTRMTGPTDFGLRAPDGTVKTVTVDPQPFAAVEALGFAPSMRPAGPLDDVGAPTLFYVNVSGEVLTSDAAMKAALSAAQGFDGLVVDMRGYPGVNHYELAQRLIQRSFSSPRFLVPIFDGPNQKTIATSNYPMTPLSNPAFSGPIVLLVGHRTVSAAENFSTMLVDADRVTVVGRTSAGTNGNITGVALPGGFSFTFTGMEVQHADASKFNGVGIVPDVDAVLTQQAFAAGEDPELMAAIAALLN